MEQKLIHPIFARFVGIYPQSWHDAPVLRLEFLGCTFGVFLSFPYGGGGDTVIQSLNSLRDWT